MIKLWIILLIKKCQFIEGYMEGVSEDKLLFFYQ